MSRARSSLLLALVAFLIGCSPAGDKEVARAESATQDSVVHSVASANRPESATTVSGRGDSSGAEIADRARALLSALKARDGNALAALVHPKGVRFSPYAFVHSDSDVVIARASVNGLFADTTRRLWGHADGTGDPLRMSFADYYRRFVYDVDFATAPVVRFNGEPVRPGNTPSNLKAAYPGGQWVEFHFPHIEPRYEGMDWRSLWLVFERSGGEWLLTGVVHGSWTI